MEPSNHCWTGVSHTSHTSKGTVCNLLWTAFLSCVPAFWVSPLGAPGIVFQQVGLKLSLFSRSCTAILPLTSLPTSRGAPYWSVKTVLFRPIKLQEFRFLIFMRMNKSGTKIWDFSLYTSAPLWLREHNSPFSPKTRDWLPFPGWS